MNQQELNTLVGKELMIRKAKYICLAAGEDSLLLLQICTRDEKLLKNGDPVQFVVAWHPDWYCGELTWSNGSYYRSMAPDICGRAAHLRSFCWKRRCI